MTSKRNARICPVATCDPRWRSFGDPKAVCPEHRRGIDQEDRPYTSQKSAVSTPKRKKKK